ncbi:MAG: hypothetical protein V1492_04825 [Candidatus Micrarchaeota archaeon]
MKNIIGSVEQTVVQPTQAEKLPVRKFHPLIEALTKKWRLNQNHVDYDTVSYCLTDRLNVLNDLFGGREDSFDKLSGKKILDLGCGSRYTYDNMIGFVSYVMYEPWLCRALNELGAFPTGIDFNSLDGEPFNHQVVDLSLKGALDFLSTSSFDAINSRFLLGADCASFSPTFERIVVERDARVDSEVKVKEMKEEFMQQALRLLKEGGVFVFEAEAFRKINNRLEQVNLKYAIM